MKQLRTLFNLITVISLLLGVIWLSPVFAAGAPTFVSLGQIKAESLRVPGAMDLDGSGNLYVADSRGGLVHTFSPYGDLLRSFDLQASGRGLAVTPDGARLYVSLLDNSVVIVDAVDGSVLGSLAGAVSDGPEFGVAGDIDLDVAGNVFVADTHNMLVKIYNASGQYQGVFGGPGIDEGQFKMIGGMAINPAGQVVVVDASSENGKIHVFSIGAGLDVLGVTSYRADAAANFGVPVMIAPKAVAFDAQGRGYFLESESHSSRLRVASESFSYLGSYSQKGRATGQLKNVTDVIFDNVNSRLFVGCDTRRIEILGVDGGQLPAKVNHAPTTPVLQGPVAGSEVTSVNPTLVINNSTDEDGDALTYHVVISQDSVVVSELDVAAEAGATTNVVVAVELAENAAFTWTAQATDGAASSAVSDAASFVVNAVEEAPSVPELIAPVNGVSVSSLDAFSWGASTDPDPNDNDITYQVEVALDEAFTDIVATEKLAETTLSLGSLAAYNDLVGNTAYFWRVISLDDEQKASAPSDAGQFVYQTTALTITANMPDAMVSVSGNHAYAGQEVGVAPFELRDFIPGTFSVVVERSGFEPFVTQVTLSENEGAAVYAELVPAKVVNERTASARGINGKRGLSVGGAAVPFLVDFDNDGALDLLVGDATGQITLFANMQKVRNFRIAFDAGVSLGLPVLPGAVPFVADWNNDDRKDLIVGLADGSVKLFINQGLEEAPAFGSGVDLQVGGSALSVGKNAAPVVVDYNGDGKKDLLVGNASGRVKVYMNEGSDAAPVLSAPVKIMKTRHAVVPFMVDWDADGQLDLLLTTKGKIFVYSQVDGVYQRVQIFRDNAVTYTGVFPIDLDGLGKQLLVGQSDGQLVLLTGKSTDFSASFHVAMQDKVAELAERVTAEASSLSGEVNAIKVLVVAGDYASAALAADALASSLPAGSAQTVAFELAALCP